MTEIRYADKFPKIREIGRGAFAEVWETYDRDLEVPRALKIVHHSALDDPEEALEEARIGTRLNNENIIQVYHADRWSDEEYFLVMDLHPRGSVRRAFSEPGRVPIFEARRIASDFLSALEAAHSQDILHRDVKPENILVSQNGRAILTDFGLAKRIDLYGSPVGTPVFTAPDVFRSGTTSVRSDVYSAGATLYAMLNGFSIFEDIPEAYDYEDEIVRGRFPPRSRYLPCIPTSLVKAVNGALHVDPRNRTTSARELRREIEACRIPINWVSETTDEGWRYRGFSGVKQFEVEVAKRDRGNWQVLATKMKESGQPRRIAEFCDRRLSKTAADRLARRAFANLNRNVRP